jgi:hypothetical protein
MGHVPYLAVGVKVGVHAVDVERLQRGLDGIARTRQIHRLQIAQLVTKLKGVGVRPRYLMGYRWRRSRIIIDNYEGIIISKHYL